MEKYIPGRELTVAVLNGMPLTVTDIVTDDWYNYDAKYEEGGSKHLVPADIDEKLSEKIMQDALMCMSKKYCRLF